MNRVLTLTLVGWVILMAEASLLPIVPVGGFRPDGIAALILVLGLKGGDPFDGLVVTFLLASMLDVLGGGPPGLELVSLTAMYVLAVALVNRVFLGNFIALLAVGLIMFSFRTLVSVLALKLYDPDGEVATLLLRNLVPSTIATGVLFVATFGPFAQLLARLSPAHEEHWAL